MLNGRQALWSHAFLQWARKNLRTQLLWGNLQGWAPRLETHRGTCTSYRRSFTAECFAWLTARCVIEGSRMLALANGFVLTKDMGRRSRVLRRTNPDPRIRRGNLPSLTKRSKTFRYRSKPPILPIELGLSPAFVEQEAGIVREEVQFQTPELSLLVSPGQSLQERASSSRLLHLSNFLGESSS